jgi:hypothetical protein
MVKGSMRGISVVCALVPSGATCAIFRAETLYRRATSSNALRIGASTRTFSWSRERAKALFTPKQQVTVRSASGSLPSADQSARKPRMPATSTPAPVRHQEVEARASSEQPVTPEIPGWQFARIRALVKYGMTVPQVAQVHKVAVGKIERILRKA